MERRAPGTSRCPTDKGAAFVCGVNGTLLIWTVDDDDGGDRPDYILIHDHKRDKKWLFSNMHW